MSQDLIIGYDDSPGARAALEVAIALACDLNARLVIAFGYDRPEDVDEEVVVARRALLELGERVAQHALERAGAAGCEAELAVLGARPVDALLQLATERDARLIVVGSYGDSPLKGAILGSTPHKLLHLADRPVLAVPAAEASVEAV